MRGYPRTPRQPQRHRNRETSVALACVELLSAASTSFPEAWQIDWADEPHRFKLYRDAAQVPLDFLAPIRCRQTRQGLAADYPGGVRKQDLLMRLSHLLLYAAGLNETRIEIDPVLSAGPYESSLRRVALQENESLPFAPSANNYFRTVPSGGALYPWELYLAIPAGSPAPTGCFHYDAAHHSLDLIRGGERAGEAIAALGRRFEGGPSALIAVTACSWKNYFKYAHRSLRLHGLDIGVLLEQIHFLSRLFGFRARTLFQFLDRPLGGLFGLERDEESPYAVVALDDRAGQRTSRPKSLSPPCNPNSKTIQRSRRLKSHPMLDALNHFSEMEEESEFAAPRADLLTCPPGDRVAMQLPQAPQALLDADLLSKLRRRRSGLDHLIPGRLTLKQLALLLDTASGSFSSDLDCPAAPLRKTAIGIIANRIEAMQAGAYGHEHSSRSLRRVKLADLEEPLQYCYPLGNINLSMASAVFFILGSYQNCIRRYGNRGFRLLNMEAGIVAGRIYRTCSLLGLGVHAFLGFEESIVNDLLQLDAGQAWPLLGIAVGEPRRNRASLRLPMWA